MSEFTRLYPIHEHSYKIRFFHCFSATCTSMGEVHYITFDGEHYDFHGTCEYRFAKNDDFMVTFINQKCGYGRRACYKLLKLIIMQPNGIEYTIRLVRDSPLIVNGRSYSSQVYPYDGVAEVRKVGSMWTIVEFHIRDKGTVKVYYDMGKY